MIRSLKEGALLHADYAPFLTENWSIKNIDSELAWNIFLEVPKTGGECIVYNRQWQLKDNQFITDESYGYSEHVIINSKESVYKPQVGDLVIFNSRNFHKVNPSKGPSDRITIGGHIGRVKNTVNELISWV